MKCPWNQRSVLRSAFGHSASQMHRGDQRLPWEEGRGREKQRKRGLNQRRNRGGDGVGGKGHGDGRCLWRRKLVWGDKIKRRGGWRRRKVIWEREPVGEGWGKADSGPFILHARRDKLLAEEDRAHKSLGSSHKPTCVQKTHVLQHISTIYFFILVIWGSFSLWIPARKLLHVELWGIQLSISINNKAKCELFIKGTCWYCTVHTNIQSSLCDYNFNVVVFSGSQILLQVWLICFTSFWHLKCICYKYFHPSRSFDAFYL